MNAQDKRGATAFHRSVKSGTMKVADLLVKAKADLNVLDNNGATPVHWSKNSGHVQAFEAMLAINGRKAKENYIVEDTEALVYAAHEGTRWNE